MITRRCLLSTFSRYGLGFSLATLFPQSSGYSQSVLPIGIGSEPDYHGPLPKEKLGKNPALKPEETTARAILAKAPTKVAPVDVARYFLAVGRGDYGREWQPYASGWPIRWNPVIVSFFQATGTTPEGDTTPWCAAFVNWCFLRSRSEAATHNASSGSFRCFGTPTNSPSPGDIVVFKERGADGLCIGHGHVGFFVGDDGASVEVLGGNQIDGHDGSHSISSKRIKKDGSLLTLLTYRSYR